MVENNYFSENQDLLEQFDHLVDWAEVVEAYENGFSDHKKYQETGDDRFAFAPATVDDAVQYYRTILDSVGDLTGHQVAPVAADMEAIGLKYDNGKVTFPQPMIEAYNKVREAGVQPYAISRKFGGLGLPSTVQCIEMELLGRADGAFGIAIGCVNLAETIERFADEDMVQTWVPQMAEGNVCGAMALTEPNYGSDLPNIRTRAEKDENGVWRINGTKRFITHGCGFAETPSVILTLARTGSPTSGAKGLSFFLVRGEDVYIAGIEKKLGLHCSPTCEVVYENAPAQLIGKEGFGLVKYAMGMMNAA
ncbi:MAG: acyl-CoA dehydrogenase family protein, partial [Leptospiraceae bacterium]|nr:acyl-CoA dehydrogenase family protein [Leptospiraceae bacterium]